VKDMTKTPTQIAEAISEVGRIKTDLSLDKMFILAILAGVYIGFGAQLATTVGQDLGSIVGTGLSMFIEGAVFSVGLMLVVIGSAELFTGNNLLILSLYNKKITLLDLLRNWAVVYGGNFVGSILLVFIVFSGGLYAIGGNAVGIKALMIANNKVNLTFVQAFCRGIACNWLVCLAVWLSLSSDDTTGKILSCFFPIMAFVASGFEHSIANMYFVPMGILLKSVPSIVIQSGLDLANLNWAGFILNNLLPVTIGNLIGGAFFVGTLYWYIHLRSP
jgi:formate/nitrite transporter